MPPHVLSLRTVASKDPDEAAIACYRLFGDVLKKKAGLADRGDGVCRCRDWCRCDIREEVVNKVIEKTCKKIKQAVAGDIPRTKRGEPVREWVEIAEILNSPESEEIDLEEVAEMLRRVADNRADPDTPRWVRALWAQCLYYPCKHIHVEIARADRVARGVPAHPERIISGLDVDDVTRSVLREFIFGVCDLAPNPYALPKTRQQYDLSERRAADVLNDGLRVLREKKPDEYAWVMWVVRYTTGRASRPRSGLSVDPASDHLRGGTSQVGREPGYEEVENKEEEGEGEDCEKIAEARRILIAEFEKEFGGSLNFGPHTQQGTRRRRHGRHGSVVRTVSNLVDIAHGRTGNVPPVHRRSGRRSPNEVSREELERLAELVCIAGVAWTEALLADIMGPPAPKPGPKQAPKHAPKRGPKQAPKQAPKPGPKRPRP